MGSLACVAATGSAFAQERGLERPMQLAAISPDSLAARGLGRPVVLSRSDVESPLARIRAFDVESPAEAASPPVADPAFKSVLLTPRDTSGTVAEPQYQAAPPVEDQTAPGGATNGKVDIPQRLPAPSASPGSQRSTRSPSGETPRAAPKVANTVHAQPKYGPAEIAATRAFTRF